MTFSQAALVALALSTASPAFARPAQAPVPGGITARAGHAKGDPLENFNRRMFALNLKLDHAVFHPLARGYDKLLPQPVHHGIRNFLRNLTEPIVFLNDLLQLKPGRAIRTFTRFAINSTIGVGGILDVAVTGKLPYRHNGFGNTLGHYGVGPGPYVFLPFVGPGDLRDLGAGQVDRAVLPLAVGKPFNRLYWIIPTGVVGGLELRNASDEDLRNLLSGAADPYATLRSVYLQSRLAEIGEIKGGKKRNDTFDDPLKDPASSMPTPVTPDAGTPKAEVPTPPNGATPPDPVPLTAHPAPQDMPKTDGSTNVSADPVNLLPQIY